MSHIRGSGNLLRTFDQIAPQVKSIRTIHWHRGTIKRTKKYVKANIDDVIGESPTVQFGVDVGKVVSEQANKAEKSDISDCVLDTILMKIAMDL